MPQETNTFFSGSPKTMFFSGFVTGVALLAIVSVFYLIGPTTDEPANEDTGNNPIVVVEDDPDPVDPVVDTPSNVPAISADEFVYGDINAPVQVIEYTDFQCPYCDRHHPNVMTLLEEFDGQLAYTIRQFPLTSIHPQAVPAATAALCAGEQGKYFEYADMLFENQSAFTDGIYETWAAELGLDTTAFSTCFADDTIQDKIEADVASGSSAGVRGTPATFINGKLISGAVPYATLKAEVEEAL